MITKLKTCSSCHKEARLWKSNPPLCKSCAAKTYKPKTSTKYENKRELNTFFSDMVNRIPERCENCGDKFGFIPLWQAKWVIAHILPKQPDHGFPTVATEPENILFLCTTNGCHANFDNKGREYRSQMPCYPLALKRFNKFKHKLSEPELIRAYEYLNIVD